MITATQRPTFRIARVLVGGALAAGLQISLGITDWWPRMIVPSLLCYVAADAIVAWWDALPSEKKVSYPELSEKGKR